MSGKIDIYIFCSLYFQEQLNYQLRARKENERENARKSWTTRVSFLVHGIPDVLAGH